MGKLNNLGKSLLISQMNIITLIASLSLIVQIVTLSIVIYGYILKRKTRFAQHGTLMLVAVAMQFVSFMLIMGPAFLVIVENGFSQKPILISAVTLAHVGLGTTALATGIWITGSWHLQTSITNCMKKSYIMRYLIVIWILALSFGITHYVLTYLIT
ncbi:MAG: hypothetical protein ABSF44_14130 [Candidatus Bathyarchaeia archaeon]